MTLKDTVIKLAETGHQDVVAIRRHLHSHPELSFKEEQTGKYIQGVLERLGIAFTDGWAGHGIVGMIEGNRPDSGVIALRADIDALPIVEQNDVPYKSQNDGVMHACGHDVHASSLLGAAAILVQLKNKFDGTIKLIFQPGEEVLPGGASIMIREGLFKDPAPGSILGQHVHPPISAGSVGFRSGEAMASADEITLKVIGKGGHGAMPDTVVDPIAISAQIITALQQIVSRSANPLIPTVLTFGKIASDGGAFNVIPETVTISGTFRTFNESWRIQAHEKIARTAAGVAEGMGGRCEVRIDKGYPVLLNDPGVTARCRTAAVEFLGPDHVQDMSARMTAEDFAYYTHEVPGCFYRLGVGNPEKGITSSVHTPTFDIDEAALQVGAGLMAWLAINELASI